VRHEQAPGWVAIDAALAAVVGDVEPQHWGNDAVRAGALGLWGLSAYPLDGHWLFVTYGLTELFGKASGDPGISGWGEELTMRVARTDGERVPAWPVRVLGRLGQLVFERATPFLPGGRLAVPGAAQGAPPALCFALDPQLAPVEGPLGRFIFTTAVGIPTRMFEAMRDSTTDDELAPVRERNPLLISGTAGLIW
jgi:hypothetical protein